VPDEVQSGRARAEYLSGLVVERSRPTREGPGRRRLVDDEARRAHVGAKERILDAGEVLDEWPVRMTETAESEESRDEKEDFHPDCFARARLRGNKKTARGSSPAPPSHP
jgi:hypothetical protein